MQLICSLADNNWCSKFASSWKYHFSARLVNGLYPASYSKAIYQGRHLKRNREEKLQIQKRTWPMLITWYDDTHIHVYYIPYIHLEMEHIIWKETWCDTVQSQTITSTRFSRITWRDVCMHNIIRMEIHRSWCSSPAFQLTLRLLQLVCLLIVDLLPLQWALRCRWVGDSRRWVGRFEENWWASRLPLRVDPYQHLKD